MIFKLRFPLEHVPCWADRYRADEGDVLPLIPKVRAQGFLEPDDFLVVAKWKSPRSQPRCRSNSTGFIREVTRCAFAAKEERLRIEVLTLLQGVGWPTASVVLHFFHPEPYPILDFRALWSLGVEVPPAYDFGFWWRYTVFCRGLADRASADMRQIDRALWQFSKEHQDV